VFTYTPSDAARQAAAGGTTGGTITLSDPARVSQGSFRLGGAQLYDISLLNLSGTHAFNYVATYFTAGATQTYVFDQTSAPVDTVMVLYRGAFDPLSPALNAIALNDDGQDQAFTCGSSGLCPRVSANLTQGQVITLVVTTYSSGSPLGLPLSFRTNGPGGFSSAPTTDSFTVTISDGHGGSITKTVTVPITPATTPGGVSV
jgi:hypothetical protein